MSECDHGWVLDRPESDTWECLDCGVEGSGYPPDRTDPTATAAGDEGGEKGPVVHTNAAESDAGTEVGPASTDDADGAQGGGGRMSGEVYFAGKSMCPSCKRQVRHKPRGGPHRWHGCRLRWVARRVAQAESHGWNEGYKFALDNVSDPMVYADLSEYGSGWAGVIERGGLTVRMGDGEEW